MLAVRKWTQQRANPLQCPEILWLNMVHFEAIHLLQTKVDACPSQLLFMPEITSHALE
jgi:hypothetical protein